MRRAWLSLFSLVLFATQMMGHAVGQLVPTTLSADFVRASGPAGCRHSRRLFDVFTASRAIRVARRLPAASVSGKPHLGGTPCVASAGFNLVGLNCVDTDFRGQWRIEAEDHRTHYGPVGVSHRDRFI
jgi:hypothetical protein